MADAPITTFDIIAVAAVIGALVTTITVLWRSFMSKVAQMEEERKADRATIEDCVNRIRDLEAARLSEVKAYAEKLEAAQRHQQTVFTRVVNAIQDIVRIVSAWHCNATTSQERHSTPAPDVGTEALLRNDARVKAHEQEESARP